MLYPAELLALSSQTPYKINTYANSISCENPLKISKSVDFVALFDKSATRSATNLKVIIQVRLYISVKKNNNLRLSILVNNLNLSTKKPVLSTPTKRTQTLVFFWLQFGLFSRKNL